MASWLATGPPVMVCWPPARVVTIWSCRWKFWIAPPAISTIARDDRDRQQDADAGRGPGRPRSCRARSVRERANPRTSAMATAMPTAAETKFCTARPAICTRWPMRRLTRVGLPVGVGDEADRGVPRQRRRHRRRRVVEVQRQLALHQLEDEQEQDADRRERQHAAGVGAPGLLRLRVGADQPVDAPARRGVLLRAVDPVHVVAERHVHGRERQRSAGEEDDPRRCRTSLRTSPGTAGRRREQRQQHRQDQADDVLVAHSRSTSFCTRPSRPKIATVSTMYMTTPMSLVSPFTTKGRSHWANMTKLDPGAAPTAAVDVFFTAERGALTDFPQPPLNTPDLLKKPDNPRSEIKIASMAKGHLSPGPASVRGQANREVRLRCRCAGKSGRR